MRGNSEEAKEEFAYIVKEYILPLIPTDGEARLRQCDAGRMPAGQLIIYEKRRKCLMIYPCLKNPQIYFEIDSEEVKPDLGAAESILNAIMNVSQYTFSDNQFPKRPYDDLQINKQHVYRLHRYAVAYELGLCQWLGGMTIYRLLDKMSKWAQKTYEGKRIPFSFIIDAKRNVCADEDSRDFIEFLGNDHSAVFTDGLTSGIKLDNDGKIIKYFSLSGVSHEESGEVKKPEESYTLIPLAPYRFTEFANQCRAEGATSEWIGVISQTNGDILVFKGRSLVFAKRSGQWFFIDSNRIIQKITSFLIADHTRDKTAKRKFAREVYLSLLDVSFSHTGGCFAAVYGEENEKEVIAKYISSDYLDSFPLFDGKKEKKDILRKLMCADKCNKDRIFYQIDRKLRQDLLGLDGATVVDANGRILGSGAIVKIDGGSDEGGRTAAAKQLSKYGFAIKVSMDGGIQVFKDEDRTLSLFYWKSKN